MTVHPTNNATNSHVKGIKLSQQNMCVVLSRRTRLLSASEVGGKAHNLIKLFRMNVPVPDSCVVTCAAYDEGKDDLTVPEAVMDVLKRFLNQKKRYAVRSSATCEDGSDSAYAGKFITILNVPGTLDDISKAIIECWKSFRDLDLQVPDNSKMGVVVMKQIDSKKAGVLFQLNPITGSRATYVINAGYGQGEGITGGRFNVDMFSLKESTLEIKTKQVAEKTHMLVLGSNGSGVEEVEVPIQLQKAQCLTDGEIVEVSKVAKLIRSHCRSPQDIEFCFDAKNRLYIIQTRPITTRSEYLQWKPPEPGVWQLFSHFPMPMSEFYKPCWLEGYAKGVLDTTLIAGTGLSKVDTAIINGFSYFCFRNPGPKTPPKHLPPPFVMRNIIKLTNWKAMQAAIDFWKNKRWREFMEKDYPERKAMWNKLASEWRERLVKIKDVSDSELALAIQDAQAFGKRMFYEHVSIVIYNILPIGHWVKSIIDATGCSAAEGFSCLDGFSPISHGICGEFPEFTKLICEDESLRTEVSNPRLANDLDYAVTKWKELIERPNKSPAEKAVVEIFDAIKYRLAEGYDCANGTLVENPTLLFTSLQDAIRKHNTNHIEKMQTASNSVAEGLLNRVANPSKRAELKELLEEARLVSPLRDERAILTALTAFGLIHHVLLEAGRRLAQRYPSGSAVDSTLALYASCNELVHWLRDKADALPPEGFWAEMRRRKIHRETADYMDAPSLLGGELLIPEPDCFPDPLMARSALLVVFIMDNTFAAPDLELVGTGEKAIQDDRNVVIGYSGSAGKARGLARIVTDASDAVDLQPGEICVTKYPSPLINILLGKARGIVTDFGGILCHAAICAREAHVPCVVGCHTATSRIKNGDLIEVDGTSGIVRILPRNADEK